MFFDVTLTMRGDDAARDADGLVRRAYFTRQDALTTNSMKSISLPADDMAAQAHTYLPI